MRERQFSDPETGTVYRVTISPLERKGGLGVDRRLNAICYEALDGSWVGSAPVYRSVRMEDLSECDLEELLDQAIGWG